MPKTSRASLAPAPIPGSLPLARSIPMPGHAAGGVPQFAPAGRVPMFDAIDAPAGFGGPTGTQVQ